MTRTVGAALVASLALGMTALTGCGGGDAAEIPEPEEIQNAYALEERYGALASEVNAGVQDISYRVERVLVAPDGDRPEEQLGNALGPEDRGATEGDLFDNACSMGGVSCEVDGLEGLLENDREDFADAAVDEYAPDACDITTDRAYYEGYDLEAVAPGAVSHGADYVKLREKLRDASSGLGDEATRLAQTAREMEAAERDYEEASGLEGGIPSHSAAEVEELAGRARAAESETGDALAAAEARYSSYEERVEEVRAEALALHDAEGC